MAMLFSTSSTAQTRCVDIVRLEAARYCYSPPHIYTPQSLRSAEGVIVNPRSPEVSYRPICQGLEFVPEDPSLVPRPLVIRKITEKLRCIKRKQGELKIEFEAKAAWQEASNFNKDCDDTPQSTYEEIRKTNGHNAKNNAEVDNESGCIPGYILKRNKSPIGCCGAETRDTLYVRLLEETQHDPREVLSMNYRAPEDIQSFWNHTRAQLWPSLDDPWSSPYVRLKWN